MRTQDFRDANKNGVDDRDEKTQNNVQGYSQDKDRLNQLYQGQKWGNTLIEDLFTNGGDGEDEGRSNMRNAFQFDVASKFMNTQLGMAQSEFNLAQNKEGMAFANMLDRQTMQESRNHIFGLNMKTMDKQFALNDEFANRDYGRNLGMLAATGEQTRKNYAAEGQQQRLGMLVAGEQQRLGIAATGDQQRKNLRVSGQEQRAGIQETGKQTRANMMVEGLNQRAGIRTAGSEQRKGIAATGFQTRLNIDRQGINDRLGYRVQGDEQRKNIAATGVENRKQAVTEGEQKRLNIGKTADEQRTTMTHSDNIAAGRERRQNAAARAAVRSF